MNLFTIYKMIYYNYISQPYYFVTISPWPIMSSFCLMNLFISTIKWFHDYNMNLMIFNTLNLLMILFQWWRDIIRESTFQGFHTTYIVKMLRFAMILFIISELFFFLSLFWAFFHNALSPSIELGSTWPPKYIIPFNPYSKPLLNTIILLSSGVTITWSHYMILYENYSKSMISLILTILLGMYFSILQFSEFYEAPFCMSDSSFGSTFFLITGFHGIHVLIGLIFISITLIRLSKFHFSKNHHFSFEASSWYWHFIDVIWLFVYIFVYWWFFYLNNMSNMFNF